MYDLRDDCGPSASRLVSRPRTVEVTFGMAGDDTTPERLTR
jgi:hypothetical protein